MNFEFCTTPRIIFGKGEFANLPALALEYGARCFIVTGRSAAQAAGGAVERLSDALQERSAVCEVFERVGEPTVTMVDQAMARAREFQPAVVIGMGGGSAIDLGKAVSGLLTNGGGALDYLEGVGAGRKIDQPTLPFIAVPTTAGAGAEATKNAVISAADGSFKKSMRSPLLLPNVAVVDPELTVSCPPALTAACGFDALAQLIEAFTSNQAQPITDSLAVAGIERASRSLYAAWRNGADLRAREDLSLAALFSGIALANAGLGAVHGLAAPLGVRCGIPHGAACAILLPAVIEANVHALMRRDPDNLALEKYAELAMILSRTSDEPSKLVQRLRMMQQTMKMPRLGDYGVTEDDIAPLVAASGGSSMKFNPVKLYDEELARILTSAL
jgi:alcohol dehydrogenase class IV